MPLLPLRKSGRTRATRLSRELLARAGAALALAVVVGTFPSGAGSQVASQTFTPVADAFVSSSKPKTNYGTAQRLKMDRSPVLTTYVRFNLSNLTGSITRATLQVYSRTSSSVGFDVRAVANNVWAEKSITYANAPAFSSTSSGLSGSVKSGTWTTLDVTSLITRNGAVSIALTTPSMSEVDVDSRQGTRSPKLTVQTASSDATAPTPPGNLAVTSAAASSLGLSWSASTDDTGVTGYDVFLNGTKVGSTTSTGYSFGSLACGTNYTLDVEAFDAAGNHSARSSLGAATSACPGDTQPPSAPTSLAASNVTSTSLTLSWQASTDDTGVAGYDLFLNGSKVGSATTAIGYPFGSLSCGTSYTLGAEAYDAAGNHSTRATLDATTSACPDAQPPDAQPPSAPTNLAASATTQTSLSLSWSASTDDVGVTGYDLYSNGIKVGSTTAIHYTFSGLGCGTSYTLGVEAFDAAGNHSTRASVGGSTAACTVSIPFRYAYFGDSDPAANKALGATMIDVGSKSSADALPAGLQGMVWVGDYDNTTCNWEVSDASLSSTVAAAIGDPKVYGFVTSDEPNPLACPSAPAQHRTRSDLIHSIDPTAKTFIILDSNGFSGNLTQDAIDQIPLWVGTADLIGLDPYPCLVNKSCNYTFISNTIAKADSTGIPYVGVLQAFDGTGAGEEFRRPTASELQTMVNLWAASHEVGSGYFAWEWPSANWYLNAHPDLESVIQSFYTGSSTIDTTAPSAPSGLIKSAATTTSVSLSWTASTDNVGVTGYNVYKGSSLVGSTTSTSYTVGSLACGTSYTFGVEARDAAGNVSTRTTLAASTSGCTVSSAPVNTALPAISGTTSLNSVLSASTGTWSNSPTGYAYQWLRCDTAGANCAAIAGATAVNYTLVSADQGFTIRLVVTATNVIGSTAATSAQTTIVTAASTTAPTLVAAGDLCGSPTDCTPTANLIGSIMPTAVLTLGDHAYTTGSASDFATNYDPNWGQYKSITKPAPGNHEYDYGNQQTGYFAYFNNPPAYYSYDVGSWHVISLNGEISSSTGSAQETWLRSDLAAHTNMCTLAYWHEPRWSSGYHGGDSYYGTFWTDLYNGGADLVLNGHDHDYERFAPQNPSGSLDTATGIREFVVGTGGDSHYAFNAPTANSEVRDSTSFGVLKLTLHATGYDWKFVPISGATFTDSGSGSCH